MKYSHFIQQSIEYVENHLYESLSLEQVAEQVGFSSFHFHRLFSEQTGITIADYIRQRRLCQAALMLIHSDEPILHIALHCRFESQEAFTRAFKKLYSLPPGRYRKLFNDGRFVSQTSTKGENSMQKQSPTVQSPVKGWFLSGTRITDYEMGLDYKQVHTGSTSAYLRSLAPCEAHEFATMMQQIQAARYTGKRMRFSGFIKTNQLSAGCGLWMRIDDLYENILQFDNMSDRLIIGTTEWNHYSIVLDIPSASSIIAFGLMLIGSGQVWIDSLQFEEVSIQTPTTHMEAEKLLAEEPVNLSFEE